MRWVRVERDVFGGEEVGVCWVVVVSLIADVFVEVWRLRWVFAVVVMTQNKT